MTQLKENPMWRYKLDWKQRKCAKILLTASCGCSCSLSKGFLSPLPPLQLWNMEPACWLWKKNPGFRVQVHEESSPYLLGAQDQQPGAKQDQLLCRSTGTSSGNCREMETCTVWACYTPWQPLQNHPSGHLGGRATPWSAEEMLGGQHQRVDIHAHARAAHKGLLRKGLEQGLCWIVPHVPLSSQSVKGLSWTDGCSVNNICHRNTFFVCVKYEPLKVQLCWFTLYC